MHKKSEKIKKKFFEGKIETQIKLKKSLEQRKLKDYFTDLIKELTKMEN